MTLPSPPAVPGLPTLLLPQPGPGGARYRWGQEVRARIDLYNDGSMPEAGPDQLLIAAGGPGEIVKVGHHEGANVPLYMVDFGLCVLGCLEDELEPGG